MHYGCKNKAVRRPEDNKCAALEAVYFSLMNWDDKHYSYWATFFLGLVFGVFLEPLLFGLSISINPFP